jgi:hypothetical protein
MFRPSQTTKQLAGVKPCCRVVLQYSHDFTSLLDEIVVLPLMAPHITAIKYTKKISSVTDQIEQSQAALT